MQAGSQVPSMAAVGPRRLHARRESRFFHRVTGDPVSNKVAVTCTCTLNINPSMILKTLIYMLPLGANLRWERVNSLPASVK
jgi:hypothetical protein